MGRDHLHAHPGCCDSHRPVSDIQVRRETGLCLDAERLSAGLSALWICLESAHPHSLSIDPGHRRGDSLTDGNDLAVPGFPSRGARYGGEHHGDPADDCADDRTGTGWLPGQLVWMAMGILYQRAIGHRGSRDRAESTAASAIGTAEDPLRWCGFSHRGFRKRTAALYHRCRDEWQRYDQHGLALMRGHHALARLRGDRAVQSTAWTGTAVGSAPLPRPHLHV